MDRVKNKFLIVAITVCFIVISVFIVSSYVSAQTKNSGNKDSSLTAPISEENNKEDKEDSEVVIKIPPPIEGVKLPQERKPQSLKTTQIAILTSDGSRHKYTVELAVTPEQHRIGMMFRDYIEENTGMLFVFKDEAERNFWMKNTFIPLDLIFIRKDGVITHIHPMAEEESLKPISSNGRVMAVLEIAGGEAEILGINVGDRILYKDF